MIGIISDIHGNSEALQAVLKKLDDMYISEIVCLGDICGYYNQVNECCNILRQRGIFSLMGNHDWYLVTGERCPRSNSANVCLDYQRAIITPENRSWLASLTPSAKKYGLELAHGGWNDPLDEYVHPSEDYFSNFEGSHFASGHTHIPSLWFGREKNYCNPGSVGQPRDGDPRASFAIWNGETFELHRADYHILAVQNSMSDAGFSSYFYENLAKGIRIGA